MKRIFVSIALVVSLFVVAAPAQSPAPQPGPEHKRMHVWIGNWTCEQEAPATPFGPGGKSSTQATVKMILDGFAQEWQMEVKGPQGVSHSIWIYAYDSANMVYTGNGYGNDGGMVSSHATVDGNVWHWSGTGVLGGKQVWFREKDTFAADLTSYTGKMEVSVDEKTWVPADQIQCTKVQPEKKR